MKKKKGVAPISPLRKNTTKKSSAKAELSCFLFSRVNNMVSGALSIVQCDLGSKMEEFVWRADNPLIPCQRKPIRRVDPHIIKVCHYVHWANLATCSKQMTIVVSRLSEAGLGVRTMHIKTAKQQVLEPLGNSCWVRIPKKPVKSFVSLGTNLYEIPSL